MIEVFLKNQRNPSPNDLEGFVMMDVAKRVAKDFQEKLQESNISCSEHPNGITRISIEVVNGALEFEFEDYCCSSFKSKIKLPQ